jgi:hypothetical protein
MSDLRNNGPQNSDSIGAPPPQTVEAAVRIAFARQARICPTLGSPFMGALMAGIGARLTGGAPFPDAVLGWPGRPWADALALRVAGGLHALARSGLRPALSAAYPGGSGGDAVAVGLAAMAQDGDFLLPWLDSAPQTNEVGRSSVLLGGALHAADRLAMPFEVLEIGASAGLNLMFDRWRHVLGGGRGWGAMDAPAVIESDWQGATPPLHAPLLIRARAGCDLRPMDASDPATKARMIAYLWPDQTARIARAEAALAAVAAAGLRPDAGDAGEWAADRLARPQPEGMARMLVHSIVWPYLPLPVKDRVRAALRDAGARATAARPLAWLRLEPDGAADDASIRLTIWTGAEGPGGDGRELGRGDFHGRWARWHDAPHPIPDGGPGA